MSRIHEIREKFRLISDENASIRSFLFDELSALNAIHDNYYPYLLLKLPVKSVIENYSKNWELWDLEYFLVEPRNLDIELDVQHDALKVIAEDVLDEFIFYPTVYQLSDNKVEFEYGHDADNNNCIVVGTKLTAKVFNCRDNTASGEVVTITDNDNALVGTVATRGILKVIAKDQNNVEIDCTYTLANGVLTLVVESDWILLGGTWGDSGVWEDSAVWID